MAQKIIRSFDINTNDIKQNGESREFTIIGDDGAVFNLEVKNEDGNYYDFISKTFSSTPYMLQKTIVGGVYKNQIVFPKITDADKYDIYLYADYNYETIHTDYEEVRFADQTIDVNSSRGSNSNLVQKVIYQTLDVTITLASLSPNSSIVGTIGTDTITTSRTASTNLIPFSFTFTCSGGAALKSLVLKRQPIESDIGVYFESAIGATPIRIKGENIYPTTAGGDPTGSGTVDGAVTSGVKVVLDQTVASIMTVGDRITAEEITRDTIEDPVTVVALNPDGDNVKEFSMSKEVALSDGATLNFFKQANHRWPMADISRFAPGLKVIQGVYFTGDDVTIKDYVSTIDVKDSDAGVIRKVENVRVPALDNLGSIPVTTRNSTTNVATTTQSGNIVFSKPAYLTYGGVNAKFFGYGPSQIKTLTGYDIEFTDLKAELTEISTTTSSAPSAATSWNIASAVGIVENVSTVSGIGIDASAVDPTVTTITNVGGATWDNSGAATITVSAAQTLENGISLKFAGASNVVTISGNIKVNNVGNEDLRLEFDLEKFITQTAAP